MTKRTAKSKRLVALGDLHCGHKAGLCPPSWFGGSKEDQARQIETWDLYQAMAKRWKPINALLVNGDAIDGKGERSGGTELLTSDRAEQVQMARVCIDQWEAPRIFMTHGTAYHTGKDEDWEAVLAQQLDADIRPRHWIDVNGVTFDAKHKVGASSIPHGRHTAIEKSRLWNALWAERKQQPKAKVVLRSHVHYFSFSGDAYHLCVVLPALQCAATKFGGRQCDGTVDWGIVVFDVPPDGEYAWESDTREVKAVRTEAITI